MASGSSAPIVIQRRLSETDLATHYERELRGESARVHRPIPWERFQREAYPDQALGLADGLFTRLATGEYSAVGLFAHITSGLALMQAPFDLVAAATRVSSDELRHADYCLRMASLCRGVEVSVALRPDALAAVVPDAFDAENIDFLMLKYAAVGETLAAALLTECRRQATDPVTHALFTSLVADEVHHARLGWYFAAHRTKCWQQAERRRLADRVAEFVVDIERDFWTGGDAPENAAAGARALGVLDSITQRGVISDVMSREIAPALDALGLGGSHAWAARRPGAAHTAT
jgi:hypothetical protein